jgi:aspartyl-tRNA(Asn)/glutamyl-tRNA(Gln) amidotransferase subunit B
VAQETRGFDDASGATFPMRGKEAAHDYRYFPDPDLPLVVVAAEQLEELRLRLPELPWQLALRFERELALSPAEATELVASRELAADFERVLGAGPELAPRSVANWVRNEVLREGRERGVAIGEAIAPERLAAILALVDRGTISLTAARAVQAALWEGGDETAAAAAERLGLVQVRDEAQLRDWVDGVVAEFPRQVEELRAGREQLLAFLTGQVMKRSAGRAVAPRVQELLRAAVASAPGSASPMETAG